MLDDDTRLELIGPGRFLGEITDRWSVRAPNGGYVASYLTRALMHESPVPDPVALNVHYVAPGGARARDLRSRSATRGPVPRDAASPTVPR